MLLAVLPLKEQRTQRFCELVLILREDVPQLHLRRFVAQGRLNLTRSVPWLLGGHRTLALSRSEVSVLGVSYGASRCRSRYMQGVLTVLDSVASAFGKTAVCDSVTGAGLEASAAAASAANAAESSEL